MSTWILVKKKTFLPDNIYSEFRKKMFFPAKSNFENQKFDVIFANKVKIRNLIWYQKRSKSEIWWVISKCVSWRQYQNCPHGFAGTHHGDTLIDVNVNKSHQMKNLFYLWKEVALSFIFLIIWKVIFL